MKKILLLASLFLAIMGNSFSQQPDTILITECFLGGHSGNGFVEITNMGKSPVDLSRYCLMSSNLGSPFATLQAGYYMLKGTLQPGASYVIVGNYKRDRFETPDPFDSVDWTPPYYRSFDYDLMTPNYVLNPADGKPGWNALRPTNGTWPHAIGFDVDGDGIWNQTLGDVVVDQVGLMTADGGGTGVVPDIAGVTDAVFNHVLIRKYSVKQPNYGNFKGGMGISSEDSEWIVIPFIPGRTSNFFKTLGNHSASDPWQVSSSTVNIRENSITVPWGVRRDSLYQEFDFGNNMAWALYWGPDTLESVVTQTKDTLYMYLAGNSVTVKKYGVVQGPAPEGMNLVFPRYDRTPTNTLFLRYAVSDDFNPDTIYNIPFGTRADTLLSYLEKDKDASWSVSFADGVHRADLKTGDKLIVTAANNSVKEYYLLLNEYIPSNDASLGAIYIYGDTLFGFKSNTYNYTEMLSPDTDFPALSAVANNLNAKVTIKRPLSINGGSSDRTAYIHVMAEDDSTELVYTVTFEVMGIMKETFAADPFFSQVINGIANLIPGATNTSGWGKGWEIFNPGNTIIPMSDYIIANGSSKTLAQIVSSKDMINTMRPGYTMDSARISVGIYYNSRSYPFITDLEPGKTLVFGRGNPTGWTTSNAFRDLCDYRDTDASTAEKLAYAYNMYGFVDGSRMCFFGDANSFFLIRINNDSIFNGLKSGGNVKDYTLVDIFGAQGVANNRLVEGVLVGNTTAKVMERKKHIWKGNPNNHGSFGTTEPGSGEWDVYQGAWLIGTHPYDPYTGYISTVYSLVYKVSPDYGPDQTIGLVPPGTTVDDFLSKVIPNGADVVLSLTNADSTVIKTGTSQISDGDKLNVVSGTKLNSTIYTISVQQPRSNAVLTSGVYTINVAGQAGQVAGVPSFTTVEDLLSNLTVPEGAKMNVYDVKGQQVGTETVLIDTLLVEKTMVSDSVKLEVTAEDGITKIIYTLVITVDNPYVTSSYYQVYQDRLLIDLFQANTKVSTFLARLVPSTGASMLVLDKNGNTRESTGIMYKDDKLIVTAGEKQTVYFMKDKSDVFSTDATLREIKLNGSSMEGFEPGKLAYTMVLEQGSPVPLVEASVNWPSARMVITQATNLSGSEAERTASIKVFAEDGATELNYTILFNLNISVNPDYNEGANIYAEGKTVCIRSRSAGKGDEVEVYNLAGKKILHRNITSDFERLQVNEPAGIYIVKVRSMGKYHIEKLMLGSF